MPPLPTSAPIVVLGNHRSGSSVLMGILAANGLHLGPVIPPAPENPRGFFESRSVVETNRSILASLDRDWTCPPHRLPGLTVEPSVIKEALASIDPPQAQPWGFKDPRLLFTLPAWCPALAEGLVLVGIHRSTSAVAASLRARNGFSTDEATAIASAYAERLAEVHRRIQFPVLSFDLPPELFLDQVEVLARQLGLAWDRGSADRQFEENLRHQAPASPLDEADAYLMEVSAKDDKPSPAITTAATARRVWQTLPGGLAPMLPRHLGPNFQYQRSLALQKASQILPNRGTVAFVDEVGVLPPEAPLDAVSLNPTELASESVAFSHLVALTLLEDVPPGGLIDILTQLEKSLAEQGVAVVGGFLSEDLQVPTERMIEPVQVLAGRRKPPYLHHRDEVEAVLRNSGLVLADEYRSPGGRSCLILTNDFSLRSGDVMTPSELRSRVAQWRESARSLKEVEEERRRLMAKTAELESRIRAVTGALEEVKSDRAMADRRAEHAVEAQKQLTDVVASLSQRVQELETVGADREKLRHQVQELRKQLETEVAAHRRLRSRRSVRLALAVASRLGPLVRLSRAAVARRQPVAQEAIQNTRTGRSERDVVQAILRLRPNQGPSDGPLVSIVILTRDGAAYLRKIFDALERRTVYRSFEVVVVDNASSDDTAAVLSSPWSFPLRVIRNQANESFSRGNNQGIREARGEMVLLLNNDVDPITPGWLGRMVQELAEGRVAVGALLIYPDGSSLDSLTVQHRGIAFRLDAQGVPRAYNLGSDDPTDPAWTATHPAPAVTGAALLARREDLLSVGGLDEGYVYGAEDVDLCLRLRQDGEIVVCGDAVLFHHESATQDNLLGDLKRINRMGNWRRFAELWSPFLTRTIRHELLTGGSYWTGSTVRRVAITLTNNDRGQGWGDWYTAHELGDAFERAGWSVIYAERLKDHWYELPQEVDLIVSLLDSYDVRRAPKRAITVAWVRNWVDRWLDQPWFEEFDLVLAGSQPAASYIRARSRHDPPVMPLATNPNRFAPQPPDPTFRCDYAFTGNNWGLGRNIVPLLDVKPSERFLLFGKGWEQEGRVDRYWRGPLDYGLLPVLYASSRVVLDDTAGHTKPHGFVNARVFDALAAGALVISDNEIGSREIFGGALPTYSNRRELRAQLDRYLGDEDLRQRTVAHLREAVVAHHNYDRRVQQIVDHALEWVERPRVALKIGVPRPAESHRWGDHHFALAFARALREQGFEAEVHILPEWDALERQDVDIVVHLRGLSVYSPKPAQVNVLWIISHPDDVTPQECEKYDLVMVASQRFADELRPLVRVPVSVLYQATDPNLFAPTDPDPTLTSSVLFVGNSRRQRRPAVEWAVEAGFPLTVYGDGWEDLIDPSFLRADYFPNERLAVLYSTASVVLNDHWPDMRQHGFISNRIFDVLASGGVVVSDDIPGIEGIFGNAVPTYRDKEEFNRLVTRLLDDADRRKELSRVGRELVLREHTFAHRAATFVELIRSCARLGARGNMSGSSR